MYRYRLVDVECCNRRVQRKDCSPATSHVSQQYLLVISTNIVHNTLTSLDFNRAGMYVGAVKSSTQFVWYGNRENGLDLLNI